VLAMHTMRFHDELVDPKELDIPSPQRKPTEREIKMAGTLIDTLHTDFDPEMLTDSYRDHVLDYLDKKRKGKAPKPKKAKPPEASDDLLAALEASLKSS
jgi:DNA end-binding protein Ku